MSWVRKITCGAYFAAIASTTVHAAQAGNSQTFESIVTAAQQAQARSDFSAAAGYYRQAARLRPNLAELWANLGLMDDLAGNLSEAVKSFSQAAHLNESLFVPQLFLGIDYLKLNRPESAIPFLQKAEQIDPKDTQAPLALGRAFALTGRGDLSSEAYRRSVDLAPDDGNAWLGLGMADLQQSSADDRMLMGIYKYSVYSKLHIGETFAEQGRLVQAGRAYSSALIANPSPPPCAHASYGIVLLRQQEVSKAGSEFEQELQLNSGCSLATLGLAAVRLVQGDADEALKDLVTLWQADRGFLQENLSLLRDGLSEAQRAELLHMAQDLETHGDTPAAGSGGLSHANSDSGGSEVDSAHVTDDHRLKHGPVEGEGQKQTETFYQSGQYQKCSEALGPRLKSLSGPFLMVLAQCSFYTGDYRTASSAARQLKSMPATHVIGLYWESKADQKLAIAALTRAGETGTNSPQLHTLLGDIYRQKQRWEDAEQEYQKTLALEPGNQAATLGLAMATFSDGKNDEALAIDKALLAETPDRPEANLLAGEILIRLGHYADAETYLKNVRDTGQNFMPRVHALLGQVYSGTDRLPEALSELKLGQTNDRDGSIHYQLGRVYQKLGEKEKAEEAFRASQQLREKSDDQLEVEPQ